MGKVSTGISMSVDGFIGGPNDEVDQLFKWYFGGDVEIPVQGGRFTLKVSQKSAEILQEGFSTIGAMISGRRMFDIAQAWGGNPPYTPCIIVTHHPPQEWIKPDSPFVFVTDGVESAVRQARQLVGDKNIAIATPSITQQCLKAGLLDEIHIDLVPVVLGKGICLFEYLGIEQIQLETILVIEALDVTHLKYRVVK
jgi:dihydrofolate reductase